MTRWEYAVDGFGRWNAPQLQDILDERGAHGWELISIDWEQRALVFKRPGGEVR